jgi:hypothetical protein
VAFSFILQASEEVLTNAAYDLCSYVKEETCRNNPFSIEDIGVSGGVSLISFGCTDILVSQSLFEIASGKSGPDVWKSLSILATGL